ncbi:hypothetical protein DL93DRAFT_2225623 [Clavulina sp. PMI_390]|nr:hypothetical protein DL93DRAFT_2225623 [Clavulina sp. PMI_390]
MPGLLGYPEEMFDLESLTLQDSLVPSEDLEQFSSTRHLRLEKTVVSENGSHVLHMPSLTELVYEKGTLDDILIGILLLDAPNLSRIQIVGGEPVIDGFDDGRLYNSEKTLPSLRSLSIRNSRTVFWSMFTTIFESLCAGIRDLDLGVLNATGGGMSHMIDAIRAGADLNRILSSMPFLESLTLNIHREILLQTLSRAFSSLSDPSEAILVPQLRTLRIDVPGKKASTIAPQNSNRMATEVARRLGPRLLGSVQQDTPAEGAYVTVFGTSVRAITTLTLPRSLVGRSGEGSEDWYRSCVPNFTMVEDA